MPAAIAPTETPTKTPLTANESIVAQLEDATMSRLEQLRSAQTLIEAEIATFAETPTVTTLVVAPSAQQQQDIDVNLILSFIMELIKAGNKAPSAKTLADGLGPLENCTMPMTERNLKALACPFSLCIFTAQSPAAAADQLIGNSDALQECERRYVRRETSEHPPIYSHSRSLRSQVQEVQAVAGLGGGAGDAQEQPELDVQTLLRRRAQHVRLRY